MKTKNDELELSQNKTSLPAFMESYNKSIPISFPHVSVKILKQFRILHPALFSAKGGSGRLALRAKRASGGKQSGGWSIDRHRKKVMDWLPSHTG